LLAKFLDAAGVNTITSLRFTAGTSSLSFRYCDTKIGTPRLTATGATLQASQIETVNASAAASIAFQQQPASVYANAPILPMVKVLDVFGNVVPGVAVTLTLSPMSVPGMTTGSTPVLSGPNALTDVTGLASFPTSSVNLPGTYTVTASMLINGHLLMTPASMVFTITPNPTATTKKVR
jgi:hypothetical protein